MNDHARGEKDIQMPKKGRFTDADTLMKFDIADRLTLGNCPDDVFPSCIGECLDEREQPLSPVRGKRRAREEPTKCLLDANGDWQGSIRARAVIDERAGTHNTDESAGVQGAEIEARGGNRDVRLIRKINDPLHPFCIGDKPHEVEAIRIGKRTGGPPQGRFEFGSHVPYDTKTRSPLSPHLYKCGGSPVRGWRFWREELSKEANCGNGIAVLRQ